MPGPGGMPPGHSLPPQGPPQGPPGGPAPHVNPAFFQQGPPHQQGPPGSIHGPPHGPAHVPPHVAPHPQTHGPPHGPPHTYGPPAAQVILLLL